MKSRISKSKVLELIDKRIKGFEKIKVGATYENRYKSDYQEVYHGTETLLVDLFGENEIKNFRMNVATTLAYFGCSEIDIGKEVQDYLNHIGKCISQLKAYQDRISDLWADDEKAIEESSKKEKRDEAKIKSKKGENNNNRYIPAKLKRLLQQEANSRCPFCGETNVNTFEYHHIEAKSNGGSEVFNNLILTCSNCHSKITNKEVTLFEVVAKKLELKSRHEEFKDRNKVLGNKNIIEFNESINQGTIGNIVNIKTNKVSDIKLESPPDTIGTDADMLNYAKHLIKRYNDYRSKQPNTKNMNYAIIYRKISKDFGCAKIELLKIAQFKKFINYMYELIDHTYLGRINGNKRIKNYSSFDEFINKHK